MEEFKNTKVSVVQEKISSHKASAMYFYGDNCNVCLTLRPKIYDLIKKEFPMIKIFQVNAEVESQICAQFSVFTIPVLIVYFEGKEFKRYGRFLSLQEMQEEISRIYHMIF